MYPFHFLFEFLNLVSCYHCVDDLDVIMCSITLGSVSWCNCM